MPASTNRPDACSSARCSRRQNHEVAGTHVVNRRVRTEREIARNSTRTSCVENLSFSLRSLLALALRLVRIRQATLKPRLISLPTNNCGFIAPAAWLRMGTEGTRKQVEFVEAGWLFATSMNRQTKACLFPSLNQLKTQPTHPSFCGALRPPVATEFIRESFASMKLVLVIAHPAIGVVVENFDRQGRRLAVSRRGPVFQRHRVQTQQCLVPDKLVGLRKTYGWRLSRRTRNFLPFQSGRQPKYKSVLELFAVVGRNACVALCGEDMPFVVAEGFRLDRSLPRRQLDHRLALPAGVSCSKVLSCQNVPACHAKFVSCPSRYYLLSTGPCRSVIPVAERLSRSTPSCSQAIPVSCVGPRVIPQGSCPARS